MFFFAAKYRILAYECIIIYTNEWYFSPHRHSLGAELLDLSLHSCRPVFSLSMGMGQNWVSPPFTVSGAPAPSVSASISTLTPVSPASRRVLHGFYWSDRVEVKRVQKSWFMIIYQPWWFIMFIIAKINGCFIFWVVKKFPLKSIRPSERSIHPHQPHLSGLPNHAKPLLSIHHHSQLIQR